MKQWLIKAGNTSVQDIPVYDKDGVLVTNLADATEIKFQIKEKRNEVTPKVEKTLISGIDVDTPSAGYLRITLTPTDTGTTLSVREYFMALQIKWSATEIYEIIIEIETEKTDRLRISQDIVQ